MPDLLQHTGMKAQVYTDLTERQSVLNKMTQVIFMKRVTLFLGSLSPRRPRVRLEPKSAEFPGENVIPGPEVAAAAPGSCRKKIPVTCEPSAAAARHNRNLGLPLFACIPQGHFRASVLALFLRPDLSVPFRARGVVGHSAK